MGKLLGSKLSGQQVDPFLGGGTEKLQHYLTTLNFIPLPDSFATISRFFVLGVNREGPDKPGSSEKDVKSGVLYSWGFVEPKNTSGSEIPTCLLPRH